MGSWTPFTREGLPDPTLSARSPHLKILVVNWLDGLNPQAGGAETHLHEVFGRLASWGHEVVLLASGYPGAMEREEVNGIQIHRVGTRMTFGALAPLFLWRRMDLGSFQVVVEDLNKVPVFMPLWTPAHVPVVLLVHHLFGATAFQEASLPVAAATWLLERPIPLVFRRSSIVAVSPSTAEDLGARGLALQEIGVVPNGVDLDRFQPSEATLRYPDPTILYLGRLKRYKGVEIILQAVARLRTTFPRVRFLVAGRGDRLPFLQSLASRLGLGDTVEFLGYVPEKEKIELLRRSWVHVLTSPKEGWGISILEAAACGTPSVASRSPGLRDAVKDGETGILVPHGDVEALHRALEGLLADAGRRESMGREARRFAEGFTWDDSARSMERILQNRVAGAPSVP